MTSEPSHARGLVVDASVLIAAFIQEERDSRWAGSIMVGRQIHAPEVLFPEVTDVLRRLELSGRLDTVSASTAFLEFSLLRVEPVPFDVCAARVWALRHNVTAYDAWYVAAAELLSVPLATLDRRLATASGPRCEFLTPPG